MQKLRGRIWGKGFGNLGCFSWLLSWLLPLQCVILSLGCVFSAGVVSRGKTRREDAQAAQAAPMALQMAQRCTTCVAPVALQLATILAPGGDGHRGRVPVRCGRTPAVLFEAQCRIHSLLRRSKLNPYRPYRQMMILGPH